MNMIQENASENSKYAFLLGSALRDNDTDQLFTVYDNLIPRDISSHRLELIKEEARNISEIPEEEFNALVLNARNFSLASGHHNMTSHTGFCGVEDEGSRVLGSVMDDDANVSGSVTLDLPIDEDSGLPTSKATGSSSESIDADYDFNNEEEDQGPCDGRRGQRGHVIVRDILNPDYDEEVKLGSSTGGSSIESPRSENSVTHDEFNIMECGGVELQDMSHHRASYRDRSSCVSDHKSLYGSIGGLGQSRSNHYAHEDFTDDEMDEREHYSRPPVSRPSVQSSRLTQIHDSYKLSCETRMTDHQKVEALRLSNNCREDTSDLKSKKKVGVKDDSDKSAAGPMVDVNGNPSMVDAKNYHQMRTFPSKVENNSLPNQLGHGVPSLSTSNQDKSKLEEKKRARERKKQKQLGKLFKSDECQNYKGGEDLSVVLAYIEGKSTKISHATNTSSSSATSTAPATTKQPVLHDLAGVNKTEKAKKKTEKPNVKERQNDVDSKLTAYPSVASGKGSSTISVNHSGEITMGNNSVKDDSQASTEVVVKTSPQKIMSEANFENGSKKSADKPGASDKIKQEPELPKSVKEESKNSAVISDFLMQDHDNDSGKSQRNNTKMLKPISPKSIVSRTEKEVDIAVENGPQSPESSGLLDPQDDLMLVDSSLSPDLIPDFEFSCESKREQAFTEVKKKKKRPGVREAPSAPTYSHSNTSNNFLYKNNSSSYRPRPRATSPPTSSSLSNTSPSANNTATPASPTVAGLPINYVENNHPLHRDLSPSSFPVLPGHNKQSSTRSDGRRNSCGDISSDVADARMLYDSDRESVKSLPAAHDSRPLGDSSPVYHVTYASKVAAPRRSDTSNSPSSDSGVVNCSQGGSSNSCHTHNLEMVSANPSDSPNLERKTTVWKGSPRERRHSEGDNSALNPRGHQKSGSQECLASILSTKDSASSGPVKIIHPSCSTTSLPSDVDMQPDVTEMSNKKAASSEPLKATASVLGSSAKSAVPVVVPQTTIYANKFTVSSVAKASSSIDEKIIGAQQSSAVSLSPSGQKEKTDGSNCAATKPSAEVGAENPHKQSASVTKKTSAPEPSKKGSSSNNSKSVIFVNEPLNSKSQKLDITFGFDSSIQPAVDVNNKSAFHFSSPSPIVSTSSPSLSIPTFHSSPDESFTAGTQSLSNSQVSTSIPPLMTVPQLPPFVPPHLPSSDTPTMGEISYNKGNKIMKGPHIAGSSNGIILPAKSANLVATSLPSSSASSAIQIGPENSKQFSVPTSTLCYSNGNSPQSCRSIDINTVSTSVNSEVSKTHLSSSQCLPLSSHMSTATSSTPTNLGDSHNNPSPPHPPKVNASITSTTAVPAAKLEEATLSLATTATTPMAVTFTSSATSCQISSEVVPAANTKPSNAGVPQLSLPKELLVKPTESTKASPNGPEISTKYPNAIHVVYGLKIKPSGGCGSLFFLPPAVPKKQKRDNVSEVCSFLKRQWVEVKDHQKKRSSTYMTVADN